MQTRFKSRNSSQKRTIVCTPSVENDAEPICQAIETFGIPKVSIGAPQRSQFKSTSISNSHSCKTPSNSALCHTFEVATIADQDYEGLSYPIFGYFPPGAARQAWLSVIDDINNSESELNMYIGDIGTPLDGLAKDGYASLCDVDNGTELTDKINNLKSFKQPLVYTPGDNEWSQCYQNYSFGPSVTNYPDTFDLNPITQLEKIRSLAFPSADHSLGASRQVKLRRHEGYPELVMFIYGNILFMTLHIPQDDNCPQYSYVAGSNVLTTDSTCAEFTGRHQANLFWIEEGFREAQRANVRGLYLGEHADLYISEDGTFSQYNSCDGSTYASYTDVIEKINQQSLLYPKIEVLVVSGDAHVLRFGNRYANRKIKTLTVYGSDLSEGYYFPAEGDVLAPPNTKWLSTVVKPQSNSVFQFNAYDAISGDIKAAILHYRYGRSGREEINLKFNYNGDYKAVEATLVKPNTVNFMLGPSDVIDTPVVITNDVVLLYVKMNNPDFADIDLYVFDEHGNVWASETSGNDEVISIEFPAIGNYTIEPSIFCEFSTDPLPITIQYWIVKRSDGPKLIIKNPSKKAKNGHKASLDYEWKQLDAQELYMGAIIHENGNQDVLGTTFLRIQT